MLIGAGVVLALLLGAAACRAIVAGCPDGWGKGDLACFFLPTHTDLGIHLLSYALMVAFLFGAFSAAVSWCRQWAKMRSLTRNLGLLHVPDGGLEQLAWRLGLKDKVRLLNSEAPLCFCAGFISPHIYLSRGTMGKLTSEELEALLLHEKHHLENKHPLKMLLGGLVVSALFFILVLPDIFKRYLIEKEIAADRSAIQYQGNYRGIAGALHKLLQEHPMVPVESLTVGSAEALEYRIDYLTGHAPQYVYRISIPRLFASFLIIALLLATILAPLSGAHP